MTVLRSVMSASGWVNIQTKLSRPTNSPALLVKASEAVRMAG